MGTALVCISEGFNCWRKLELWITIQGECSLIIRVPILGNSLYVTVKLQDCISSLQKGRDSFYCEKKALSFISLSAWAWGNVNWECEGCRTVTKTREKPLVWPKEWLRQQIFLKKICLSWICTWNQLFNSLHQVEIERVLLKGQMVGFLIGICSLLCLQITSLSSSCNELLFHMFHIKLLGTENSSLGSSESTIAVGAVGFSFYFHYLHSKNSIADRVSGLQI